MVQDKLNELGRLIDLEPASPKVQALASEIKASCATDDDERLVDEFISKRLDKISGDIEQLREEAVRLNLGEISDMVNLSYIAKTYFKKSRAWLSQRINGNTVNGRPCRFTPAELDTFNNALRDMSVRLSCATLKY